MGMTNIFSKYITQMHIINQLLKGHSYLVIIDHHLFLHQLVTRIHYQSSDETLQNVTVLQYLA